MSLGPQDILALSGILCGTYQSAQTTPGYPSEKYLARFVDGLHISVIVAIFSIMSAPSVSLSNPVQWIEDSFNISMPLIMYGVIVVMGMTLVVTSSFKAILSVERIKSDNKFFYPIAIFMGFSELLILGHMLSIF